MKAKHPRDVVALFLLSILVSAAEGIDAASRARDPRRALRSTAERLRTATRLGCEALGLPSADRAELAQRVVDALGGCEAPAEPPRSS